VHGTAWKVREAGVSKVGKPYAAFYTCGTKDSSGYCNEKPALTWAKDNPIRSAAAAPPTRLVPEDTLEDLPF
jgi:hypothetical protein